MTPSSGPARPVRPELIRLSGWRLGQEDHTIIWDSKEIDCFKKRGEAIFVCQPEGQANTTVPVQLWVGSSYGKAYFTYKGHSGRIHMTT